MPISPKDSLHMYVHSKFIIGKMPTNRKGRRRKTPLSQIGRILLIFIHTVSWTILVLLNTCFTNSQIRIFTNLLTNLNESSLFNCCQVFSSRQSHWLINWCKFGIGNSSNIIYGKQLNDLEGLTYPTIMILFCVWYSNAVCFWCVSEGMFSQILKTDNSAQKFLYLTSNQSSSRFSLLAGYSFFKAK